MLQKLKLIAGLAATIASTMMIVEPAGASAHPMAPTARLTHARTMTPDVNPLSTAAAGRPRQARHRTLLDSPDALEWVAPITYECYNDGIIRADKVSDAINNDQGTVVWGIHLDIWNGRQWVDYYNSPLQNYNSNDMFSELEDSPIDVRVARNRYYLMYEVIGATETQNPPGLYRAHAEMGAVSEWACYVP